MAIYAKIHNSLVEKVIVADATFFDNFIDTSPGEWIETFTNGVRKNCAAIGFTYDSIRDAFIPPKDFPSWILNEDSCLWEAPTPIPDDGNEYEWNEETTSWEVCSY